MSTRGQEARQRDESRRIIDCVLCIITLIYSFYVLCSCFAPVLVCAPIIIIIIIIIIVIIIIEETTPRGRGFLSTLFLAVKKDGASRPANSHGFTVSLTDLVVVSRSHGLAVRLASPEP